MCWELICSCLLVGMARQIWPKASQKYQENLNSVTSRMTMFFSSSQMAAKPDVILMAWFREAGKRQWWRQSRASTWVMRKIFLQAVCYLRQPLTLCLSRAGPVCVTALNVYLKQIHSDLCNTDVRICNKKKSCHIFSLCCVLKQEKKNAEQLQDLYLKLSVMLTALLQCELLDMYFSETQ